jgi:DNA-binding winged helix-turn-helix (wHTH) protein
MTRRSYDARVSRTFHFAQFELDLDAYALRDRGEVVKLERIPMDVLTLLVERAGTLVGRSEIQKQLWGPDVFIEHDAAINTAVRKIRHALGDDADTPQFIETVVGKGYKFIGHVEKAAGVGSVVPIAADDRSTTHDRPQFPRYVVQVGKHEISVAGETLLGRDPASDVYVDDPSVSRRHARISITADGAMVEDLRSRNGTFLNGRRIARPELMSDNSAIGLGGITVLFKIICAPATTQSMSARSG